MLSSSLASRDAGPLKMPALHPESQLPQVLCGLTTVDQKMKMAL